MSTPNVICIPGHGLTSKARFCSCVVLLWALSVCVPQTHAQEEHHYAETSVYKNESIRGFTVLVHPDVLIHPADARDMRKELDSQLAAIVSVVPRDALAVLRKVRIWVEWKKKPHGAAEFHQSEGWLRGNGYNPEKAGAVEISNVRNFLEWSRAAQPWMMLHELAHAHHRLAPEQRKKQIAAAYRNAVELGIYESVKRVNASNQKAYALTNDKEYFAELSEAYFGRNDFYPFTNAELKTHDPVGYQMMKTVWEGRIAGPARVLEYTENGLKQITPEKAAGN